MPDVLPHTSELVVPGPDEALRGAWLAVALPHTSEPDDSSSAGCAGVVKLDATPGYGFLLLRESNG